MKIFKIIAVIFTILLLITLGYFLFLKKYFFTSFEEMMVKEEVTINNKPVNFSQLNSQFLFSADIPEKFEVEYLPNLRAINIYDSTLPGDKTLDKSQFYITFFRADKFLTLNTVIITQKDLMNIKGMEAILYEITKKDNVASFVGQPSWRNITHKALDIRFNRENPTYFYSFAYNPNLSEKIFEDFISSLVFHQ